jgi:hypothetical protein
VPDPEVSDRPARRRFSAKYKLRVLREWDACQSSEERGALLRREGLYRSRISEWRKKREAGELLGLASERRGRPRKPRNALEPEMERLRRANARLQEELRKARIIIDVQKKVSEMLENSLDEGSESAD